MEQYTTLKRLAELSALSPNYLYNEVRSGNLAAIKCGRAIRVALTDFEAFMAARRSGGEPPQPDPMQNAPVRTIGAAR